MVLCWRIYKYINILIYIYIYIYCVCLVLFLWLLCRLNGVFLIIIMVAFLFRIKKYPTFSRASGAIYTTKLTFLIAMSAAGENFGGLRYPKCIFSSVFVLRTLKIIEKQGNPQKFSPPAESRK